MLRQVRAAGAEVRSSGSIDETIAFVERFLESEDAMALSGRFVHVRDKWADVLPDLLVTGHRVLVEKPLGRSLAEAELLAGQARVDQLWVGLNYRFFRGIAALIVDIRRGTFGQPIALNATIGHGGAPGMEKSWKLDPIRAGGGALIDPGIHLLDLAILLSAEPPSVVGGRAWAGIWDTGVEEECHLVLAAPNVPI